MKTKLLLLLFLPLFTIQAQSIPAFHGANNSAFADLSSVNPLDHSASGPNQTWTFGNLLYLGSSTYTYVAPTTQESTTYPGTTEVAINGTTKMYTKTATGNVFSITGLTGTDLNINFSSNNATLGTFPMAYGYTNTDSNVSGTYTYTTYSGTFTGTLTTSVDSYGTLTLDDPTYGFTGSVVRMKTVLNISLNYSIFTNVGTVTQTSYLYYNNDSAANYLNNPVFRSITTAAVVPLMGIDQTNTTLDKFQLALGTDQNSLSTLWVTNPVDNRVILNSTNAIDNATISITDLLGKTIYESKGNSISGSLELPVSLTKGMYLITIANDHNKITKKIIKD